MEKVKQYLLVICYLGAGFAYTAVGDEHEGFSWGDKPGWALLTPFDYDKTPVSGQSSQYLLVDEQINLAGDKPVNFFRYAVKPLTSSALEENSEISIMFNPEYSKLVLHRLQLIRKGEVLDLSEKATMRFLQQEDQLDQRIQTGYTTALLNLEDVRVGDIIEYSYSIEGRNPIFGGKYFGMAWTDWRVTVDKFQYRILTRNKKFQIKQHVKTEKISRASLSNGVTEYTLIKKGTTPVVDEGDYPHHVTPYAWVEYSDYTSWAEVSDWAVKLYSENNLNHSGVDELAKSLGIADATDVNTYIKSAVSFVQNDIRYLGMEFGVNSHLPHSPSEVIQKRYGDCKDKSVLLAALLNRRNVRTYPALVSTNQRYGIADRLPSPGVFNHVINLVELDGERYWVDGTRTYQAGGIDVHGESDLGYALVVDQGQKTLTKMYSGRPETGEIAFVESVTANKFGGPVEYRVETHYSGIYADYQRYRFANTTQEEIQRQYIEFYSRYYADVAFASPISYEDDELNNKWKTVERYAIGEYWGDEDGMFNAPINILGFSEYLKAPKTRNRKLPYYLGQPTKIKATFKLNLPEDVSMNIQSRVVDFEHESFKYTQRDSYSEGVYRFSADLDISKSVVSAEALPDYLKIHEELKEEWYFSLNMRDPSTISGMREALALKRRLKELGGGQ